VAALPRQLLELFLLRRGPQDLPWSPPAVAACAVALLVLQAWFASQQGLELTGLLARGFVTLLILFGVTRALLRWRQLENRAAQTLLALAATGLFFSLGMFPLAMALQPYFGVEDPPARVMVLALAAMVLFFWKLRVEASIWRQALDIAVAPAYALTVSLMLAEAVLIHLLVPGPVSGAG
jgi:hypothetical protein